MASPGNILVSWTINILGFMNYLSFIKQMFIDSVLWSRHAVKSSICSGNIFPGLLRYTNRNSVYILRCTCDDWYMYIL